MAAANKSSKAVSNVIEFDTAAIAQREAEVAQESDASIEERMREQFGILTEMTKAVKSGDIRAMIVSGPPGVGKSFGVEEVLAQDDLFNILGERKPRYEVVKGAVSAIGLYCKLYEYSEKKSVIIMDDSDDVFYDPLSLNLLKAALDTGSKRWLSWNTDSRILRAEGIPDRFEFKGSIIFITNLKFSNIRSKALKDHLNALESRCHYLDLEIDTTREKLLRIKQITRDGMLDKYDFEPGAVEEILDFIEANTDKLRELSLRTALKFADLKKSFPTNWQAMARATTMKKI